MELIDNRDAQFILLGGFIIAIGLVITTVMLNNIIFQGNMAGEAGADPLKYEMVNLMQITGDEMKNAYSYSNGTTNPQKIANFSRELKNFSANLSMIYALHGEGVSMSNDTSNWRYSRYANFTKNGMPGGAPNWTVIQNVSSSNITVNITVPSGTFNISIINATSNYYNYTLVTGVYNIDNTNISSHINITNPYSIIFFNGANAYGNYSISGTASGRTFIRARDYILNATVALSASSMRANITIPVSVPW